MKKASVLLVLVLCFALVLASCGEAVPEPSKEITAALKEQITEIVAKYSVYFFEQELESVNQLNRENALNFYISEKNEDFSEKQTITRKKLNAFLSKYFYGVTENMVLNTITEDDPWTYEESTQSYVTTEGCFGAGIFGRDFDVISVETCDEGRIIAQIKTNYFDETGSYRSDAKFMKYEFVMEEDQLKIVSVRHN